MIHKEAKSKEFFLERPSAEKEELKTRNRHPNGRRFTVLFILILRFGGNFFRDDLID